MLLYCVTPKSAFSAKNHFIQVNFMKSSTAMRASISSVVNTSSSSVLNEYRFIAAKNPIPIPTARNANTVITSTICFLEYS